MRFTITRGNDGHVVLGVEGCNEGIAWRPGNTLDGANVRAMFGFVQSHRLDSEPSAFDLMLALFPDDEAKLDAMLTEILKERVAASAGQGQGAYVGPEGDDDD